MATIEKYAIKSGTRYRVRYRTPEGKQTDRRGFTTKREAAAFASTVEVDKMKGSYVAPSAGRVTIDTVGAQWLAQKASLKQSSLRSLETAWRIHVRPYWTGTQVGQIVQSKVQTWLNTRFEGKSPTVVLRAHGVLAGILDLAVSDGLIPANRARGVTLPRKTRGMHAYLTWAQLTALARECGRHGPFVLFLGTTGLRWGEAVALRGRHIDREKKRLTVERNYAQVGNRYEEGTPKSYEKRAVPVIKAVLDLVPLAAQDGHVWSITGADAPIPRPSPESGWFDAAVRRCIAADPYFPRVSPHDLRHTAASLAIAAGANVKAVQRMLGHASAAMTLDTYADLFDDDLDVVAKRMETAAKKSVGKMWARGLHAIRSAA